ncbi:hypothetical protein GCM10009569_34740 [Arthrobacter russicus]
MATWQKIFWPIVIVGSIVIGVVSLAFGNWLTALAMLFTLASAVGNFWLAWRRGAAKS